MWQQSRVRAARKYLYRLLIGFMVIWLALFYAALCEYHGLMLPFVPLSMEHMHEEEEPLTVPQHVHHPGMKMQADNLLHSPSQSTTFIQFSRMALSTAAMSFLTIAAPTNFQLAMLPQQSQGFVKGLVCAHQWDWLPPEKPPRLLAF